MFYVLSLVHTTKDNIFRFVFAITANILIDLGNLLMELLELNVAKNYEALSQVSYKKTYETFRRQLCKEDRS